MILDDQWKIHRNLITPAFHIQVLEQFVPTFNSVTDVFLEKLSENVNKTVDIFELVNLCALDIIAGKYCHITNIILIHSTNFLYIRINLKLSRSLVLTKYVY